jgi:hypothetical protein
MMFISPWIWPHFDNIASKTIEMDWRLGALVSVYTMLCYFVLSFDSRRISAAASSSVCMAPSSADAWSDALGPSKLGFAL